MSPEYYAERANDIAGNREEITSFLAKASPREIQAFIHQLEPEEREEYFQMARVALDVRLAEEQTKSTERVVGIISKLAALTHVLVWLTIAVSLLTVVLMWQVLSPLRNLAEIGFR